MNRTQLLICAVASTLIAIAPVSVHGQQVDPKQKKAAAPKAVGAPDQFVIRVYNVADLVMPTSQYPFRGTTVPTFGARSTPSFSVPMSGGATGGGGVASGVGGFGLIDGPYSLPFQSQAAHLQAKGADLRRNPAFLAQFGGAEPAQTGGTAYNPRPVPAVASQPETSNSSRFDIETLQEVLIATVDPESWNSVGGQGTCQRLGTLLIVRQAPATHEKITEFLSEVRRAGGSLRPVTVQAHWLTLEAKQLADLLGGARAAAPGQPVSRTAFEQLASSPKAIQGQVTCFDGQTVHIISGQSHTISDGVNPVVAAGAVAYDPKLVVYHTGAMLQVTPTVASGGKHAVLDLWSVFSLWIDPESPIEVQGQAAPFDAGSSEVTLPSAKLDRVKIVAQQFSTTLRVPVGQPVLVGGMTLEPGRDDSPRLYLIVEATPGDEVK
jgi:hypothetical protein